MAKAPQKPTEGQPVKFPPNWARMSQQEKRAWQEANRPGYNAAARAARPPQPVADQQAAARGAASDYNEANELNADQRPEDEYPGIDQEQEAPQVSEFEARKALANILRSLADSLAPRE